MDKRVVLVFTVDESLFELLQLLLEDELGVRLQRAQDDQELLAKAGALSPALILVDWQSEWPVRLQPGGAEVVQRLRSDALVGAIPVVALVFSREAGRDAEAAGCCDWIDKAFDIESFLAKIRQHLPKERQHPSAARVSNA